MATDLWDLETLQSGRPGLTASHAKSLVEAAAVCFEVTGKTSPVSVQLAGEFAGLAPVQFSLVSEQMRRTYADLVAAVELGACAVSAVTCEMQLGLQIVEQSRRGGGFDYWLGSPEGGLFQGRARLEVSGILKGETAQVQGRLRDKLRRLANEESSWTTWVVVVEFSQPLIHVVRR